MPIPSKQKDENPDQFLARCVGDKQMNKEYPDQDQRVAVCMSKACEGMTHIEAADFTLRHTQAKFKYRDPKTNEIFEFDRRGLYRKNGRVLVPVND